MNARLRFYFYSVAVVVLGVALKPAFGQEPPSVTDYVDPATAYHTGNFDYVDPLNHRVALDIPLVVDHSQRGNLNFMYSLRYSSTTAWFGEAYSCGPPNYTCFRWLPANNVVSGPSFSMDGNLRFGFDDYYTCNGSCGYEIGNSADDDTGAQHFLGTLSGTQRAPCSFTAESVDGSGIQVVVGSDCTTNLGAYTLTNRQGVQFQGDITGFWPGYNGGQIEDPNGNLMSFSCVNGPGGICGGAGTTTQMEDTLGRTWTYSYQVDTTGCPSQTVQANLWRVPGPNGQMRDFKLCLANIRISTSFGFSNVSEYNSSAQMMTAVILPDGTSWQFNYDSYGELTSVHLPTGGTVSYGWGNVAPNSSFCLYDVPYCDTRGITSRTSPDGTWQYNEFTVTDPALNDTVYNPMSPNDVGDDGRLNSIQYYSGQAGSGTLLKTETPGYQVLDNPYPNDLGDNFQVTYLPASTETQWANGQTNQTALYYDSTYGLGFSFTDDNTGSSYPSTYGLLVLKDDYDYGSDGPGSILRHTVTDYYSFSHPAYLSANLLDLLSNDATYNGSWNQCSDTQYGYDATSQIFGSGITMQHGAAPMPGVSGNLTSIQKWVSNNPCQSGATGNPVTALLYDYDTGMLTESKDGNGNPTTFGYAGGYYGAYPTEICNALTQCTQYSYDFNTGLVSSTTDPNNQQTGYAYDIMLRPTQISYPDGGQTVMYYSPTSVEVTNKIDGSRTTDSYAIFDGLGREIRLESANDEPNPWDEVDTCYDGAGNVAFKSYPRQGSFSDPEVCSGAGDTFQHDALGRATAVIHSDGATILTAYVGRATSVSDEGNGSYYVQKVSQVDGLGRVVSLCEVSSAAQVGTGATPVNCALDISAGGFLTTYSYDAMSNLTGVSQGGYLNRSFSYDSLSRLVSASNPESNTTGYTYDNNGNLISRIRPAPNQTNPAVTVTTNYGYDALNRLTSRTYSGDTTLGAYFCYDTTSWWSQSVYNTVGRLVGEGTTSNSVTCPYSGTTLTGGAFGYDPMGRVSANYQCPPGNCPNGSTGGFWALGYGYDYTGDMTASNGVNVTLSYAYNRAQRLTGLTSSLNDSNHPGTLFSGAHYNAASSLTSATLDTSLVNIDENRTYDGRLRLSGITDTAGSTNLYSFTMPSYTANSNLQSLTDSANGTWTYAYDQFNRLDEAYTSTQSYTYDYDRFGNRWHQNGTHTMTESFSSNNNRMDGYSYDAAGNLLSDGTTTYAYDAENRIKSATNSTNGTTTYVYDAEGRRAQKNVNGSGVDFVYDLDGHEISAVNTSNSWIRGEVYAAGRHIATYSGGTSGTTYFNFADHLGTERVRATVGGSSAETCTSLPFGDWLQCSASDSSPMHFTGQEHDSETGNDNFKARYYGSGMGRFLTPDPAGIRAADASNPQSWNQYSYVLNNPLSRVDPTGMDDCDPDTSCGDDMLWRDHNIGMALSGLNGGPPSSDLAGLFGAGLQDAANNFSPVGFQYTDDNGAKYPGLFSSWDEYASWRTSIPGLTELLDNLVNGLPGQYDRLSTNMAALFPSVKVSPEDPKLVGGHFNFSFTCSADAYCPMPGRYANGVHVENNGLVHDDTFSPWYSPFSFSNFNLRNFLKHGFIDLIGGQLFIPVFPN